MRKILSLAALMALMAALGCGPDRKRLPDYYNDRGEPVYLNEDGTPQSRPPAFPEEQAPPPPGPVLPGVQP